MNGIYLASVILGLAILLLAEQLLEWHRRDTERRRDRLVHRNLWRIR